MGHVDVLRQRVGDGHADDGGAGVVAEGDDGHQQEKHVGGDAVQRVPQRDPGVEAGEEGSQ